MTSTMSGVKTAFYFRRIYLKQPTPLKRKRKRKMSLIAECGAY